MNALSAVAVSLALAVGAGALQAADRPETHDDLKATRASIHATTMYCPGGLQRFLPGQYYFCAAVRDFGNGHDGLARERLRDAAFWASKPAQYILGLMNFNGEGIAANRPLGVAWLALAAERHDKRFEPAFAKAFLELSPAERAQANAYWSDLRTKYADEKAGRRAQRTYLAEMRNLQEASMFGGSVFIDGMTPPGDLGTGPRDTSGASTRLTGSSAFGAERLITRSADDLFQGMEGHVTVGEAQMTLVPIGSVAKAAEKPRSESTEDAQ